jgi:hypothetical protein
MLTIESRKPLPLPMIVSTSLPTTPPAISACCADAAC